MGHGQGILVTDINISLLRTNRISSNEHPLNHTMRIPFKQRAVHISTGIPFVSIADDKPLPSLCFSTGLPFCSGWKSSSSPAPQTRSFDGFYDLFSRHFGENLLKRLVAAHRDVVIDPGGIDFPVASKDNPLLKFVKRNVLFMDDLFLSDGVLIEKAVDHLSFENRFGENLRNICRRNVGVANHLWPDDHERASLTETMASAGSNLYFLSQMMIRHLLSELFHNF